MLINDVEKALENVLKKHPEDAAVIRSLFARVAYKQKIIPPVSLLHHLMPKMRIFNMQLLIMLNH
jgi:hypothetical protein